MRQLMHWRVWLAAALLGFALHSAAADIPPLKARVTDLTATLPAQSIAQLEQKLAAFEKEKGAQVAVLMVPSVQPESIEEYAVRVFEQWKLGRKGVDDGVLLVIAKNDRKLRIEVGYGLEGVLNDATAKRIISDDMVPQLKNGNFPAAVDAGVSRILRVVSGEPLPPPAGNSGGNSGHFPFDPVLLLSVFIFARPLSLMLRPVLGSVLAAGMVAAAVGAGAWFIFGSLIIAIVVGVIMFLVGLSGGSSGGSGGWSSGGGSWSSGGGGFSSGGGFSGGGGSSGGGGASGGW